MPGIEQKESVTVETWIPIIDATYTQASYSYVATYGEEHSSNGYPLADLPNAITVVSLSDATWAWTVLRKRQTAST